MVSPRGCDATWGRCLMYNRNCGSSPTSAFYKKRKFTPLGWDFAWFTRFYFLCVVSCNNVINWACSALY